MNPRLSIAQGASVQAGVNNQCHGYTGGVDAHDARVIANPQVIAVFWDPAFSIGSPLVGSMCELVTDLLRGTFIKGLAEYGVGLGTLLGVQVIDTNRYPPPKSIDMDGIHNQLAKWLDDGAVTPKPAPNDTSKVYLVFTPSATKVTDGTGACGYHGHASYGPGGNDNLVLAAVFSYAGSANADAVAYCVGHELAESFSNPTQHGYFVEGNGCEIGDLCESAANSSAVITQPYGGWNVESFWSQSTKSCLVASGGLWHTLRRAGGAPWPFAFGNVLAQFARPPAGMFQTACALDSTGRLHVCGVDAAGQIWHTMRAADGSWPLAWENVTSATKWGGGPLTRVACAVNEAGDLHVCAIDRVGTLLHTIRLANGTWPFAFGNVQAQTNQIGPSRGPLVHVACSTNPGGDLHVCVVDVNGRLFHTIRDADGKWPFAFGDVQAQTVRNGPDIGATPSVSCSVDPSGDLHVCAATTGGGLFHTIRKVDGSWPFPFGDVLAVTRNSIPSVCASLAQRHQLLESELQHVFDPQAKAKLAAELAAVVKQQEENSCFAPGGASTVACAAQAVGELHVCTIDGGGALYHAQRRSDGSWTAFEFVQFWTNLVSPVPQVAIVPHVACSTRGTLDLHICVIG